MENYTLTMEDAGAGAVPLPGAAVAPGGILLIEWGCGVCQRYRRWLLRRVVPGALFIGNISHPTAQAWLGADYDTSSAAHIRVVRGRSEVSRESTAVLRPLRHARWPWRALYGALVCPRFVRDPLYRLFARHRHRF